MSRASKKTILSSKTPRDLFRGTGLLTPQTNTPTADSDEPFMNEAPLDWGTSGINLNGGGGSFQTRLTLDITTAPLNLGRHKTAHKVWVFSLQGGVKPQHLNLWLVVTILVEDFGCLIPTLAKLKVGWTKPQRMLHQVRLV